MSNSPPINPPEGHLRLDTRLTPSVGPLNNRCVLVAGTAVLRSYKVTPNVCSSGATETSDQASEFESSSIPDIERSLSEEIVIEMAGDPVVRAIRRSLQSLVGGRPDPYPWSE